MAKSLFSSEKKSVDNVIGNFISQNNQYSEIPADKLLYNDEYERYEGDQLADMVESIRQHGILQPLIVRQNEDGTYTILSGNNRRYCGEQAKLDKFPCIIKQGITDEEAQAYIDETNVFQRGFTNLRISKQAEVLARRHADMFDHRRLTEIQREIAILSGENPENIEKPVSTGKLGRVGAEYGLSKDTVARLIRINMLIPQLKAYVDKGTLKIRPAVDLSYLSEEVQQKIFSLIEKNYTVSMVKAAKLRELSEADLLTDQILEDVISGVYFRKEVSDNNSSPIFIRKSILDKYFADEQDERVILKTIEKALKAYFKK